MEQYRRLKDFPAYIDESFYDFIDDLELQRTIIREVIRDIIAQNKNSLVTIGVLVGVLDRQLECSIASIFLSSRKFFKDSATLILTSMELRLDLEFIAKSHENELKWISQERPNKKLWNVKDQIISVSKDKSEEESDLKIYQFLSIIKHGNPAHGHLAFTISAKPGKILFDPKNSTVNPKLLMGLLSHQLDKSFAAVSIIALRNGIDLSSYESRMKDIKTSIQTKSIINIREMVSAYIGSLSKHDKPSQ